jgi:hypothetical protein
MTDALPIAFVTKGRNTRIPFVSSANGQQQLSLSLASSNPLWAKWRYATISNISMQLSDVRVAPRIDVRLACSTAAGAIHFCDAGIVRAQSQQDGMEFGNYSLVFDPDSPSSALPPHLFFILTNGRDQLAKPAATTASGLSVSLAEAKNTLCIRLVPGSGNGLLICDDDIGHFGMQEGDLRSTILIGGSFWRSNYTLVEVDGFTATIGIQYITTTTVDVLALEWVAIAIELFALVFIYARWVTSDETISRGLMLSHWMENGITTTTSESESDNDPDPVSWWPMGLVINGGMLLAIVLFISAVTVAWIAFTYEAVPLIGPSFQMLEIAFTAYSAAQLAVSIGLMIYDASISRARVGDPMAWIMHHRLPLEWAWARHTAHIGVIGGSMTLVIIPVAYQGSNNGYMALLFLLLIPMCLTLSHTTYYTFGALSWALSDRGTLGYFIFAVIESTLWLALLGCVSAFFIVPLVDVAQPFFSSSQNFVVAFCLVFVVCLGSIAILKLETTTKINSLAQKVGDKRKAGKTL